MAQRIDLPGELKVYKRPERVRVQRYVYEWGDPYEGWARGFIRRNFWRVRDLFGSEEDALQECAIIFCRCARKYQYTVNRPQWMMAIFKTAVNRSWHGFSVRDTNLDPRMDIDLPAENSFECEVLNNCGEEMRDLVSGILNSPLELLMLITRGDDYQMINRRLKRLFGIEDRERDLLGELRAILNP